VKSEFSFGQRIILLIAALAGPILIRLVCFSWRVRFEGEENLNRAKEKCGQVLFCFWHSRLLGLCYTHRYRNIGIMVSKSFDGEWIARIVTKLGYRVFRGSASRHGAPALLEMMKDKTGDLALTVDGPRGPVEKAKPGILSLASHTGLPIVPITFAADKAWRLNSWDHFIIPKPFCTVTVRYGPMISFDKQDEIEKLKMIEDGINRIG
jgi:lysophospholipid acyltransferase (LPLAT)-like uncharacterized protein